MSEAPTGVFVGLATLDLVLRVDAPPTPNEKVTATRQDLAAGGPAANAAVTFAALGGSATLVTLLGGSATARLARAELEAWGVHVVDVAEGDHELPISAITVTAATGERSIVSVDAAAAPAPPADAVSAALVGTADADVLLVDGHHPALAEAALRARDGRLTVMDAGRWKPAMAAMLRPGVEVVASADFRMPDAPTAQATVERLRALDLGVVAMTAGASPVRWWAGGSAGEVDAVPVDAVDTLGAGDAFHGGYAYARAAGDDPPTALRAAAAVAAVRCAHVGPRSWLEHLPTPPL